MRLVMPGFEGNLNIKWLRRLKFGDQPWMTRWETARYTQLLANGKARQFQLRMETNSVITSPSGMMQIRPGYNRITGLAWSGHGKIAKVEVSTDGAKTWKHGTIEPARAAQGAGALPDGLGLGRQARPRSSAAPPTRRATFSRTGSPSSPRWGRTRCSTTTPSRPGASTEAGRVRNVLA